MKKTWLIATLGVPGSGKTFFSERLAKKLGFFHLNADRLRLELYGKPKYTEAENRSFFRVMDFLAEELLQRNVSVIYDANSTMLQYRRRLEFIAKQRRAKYLLLFIETPVAVALQRLSYRRMLRHARTIKYYRPIKNQILFRIQREMEKPVREPFVTIAGSKPFLSEWPKIARAMKKNRA